MWLNFFFKLKNCKVKTKVYYKFSVETQFLASDEEPATISHTPDFRNGKKLQRIETVPDIKRDTSGITTQYIATGIGLLEIVTLEFEIQ